MNRAELQKLSRLRAREAKTLLDTGYFCGSYYLMGYAVECALKAVIARRTQRYDFPNKKLAIESHSHDLACLLRAAGLQEKFDLALRGAPELRNHWRQIWQWNEGWRYTLNVSEAQARDFHHACTDRQYGLLSWLKAYW
ncbi:hypothetical protein [Massilia sp. erpn]|uniref:hypothetical protein n=1 Tax=Massilia sp. erpn TaxID=2738142 RepID=UPI0021067F37|nr:hypothetical protein [Massilia sp. erpn]UTY56267.1 DNA-binding protein [Massilia sp. erpn]